MNQPAKGKLEPGDERRAVILKWIPWLSFLAISLASPLPLLFFYLRSESTESAAIFMLLSLASLGVGILIGALFLILFLIYRQRWYRRLRDRLASDGITASEVSWFTSELTSEERQNLSEIQKTNPLLADAYAETLASRLTATRIVDRSKRELLRVERRINNARRIIDADTSALAAELDVDRQRLENLRTEATTRLAEAKARLQMIEAAASRSLSQSETDLMLSRLSAAQSYLPLTIEMAELERQATKEIDLPRDRSL
ncbi:MAG TPA: hypothetical protein VFR80_02935 [Pyrinomonadaceae bacterium]|nr:hypothetical protein [Pyrinomonadaceae bacterium]